MTGQDGFLRRPLTDSELAEESMGGMFGGSGTTANTLAYLLWATLKHPEMASRLKEELREAFPDGRGGIPEAAVSSLRVVPGPHESSVMLIVIEGVCKASVSPGSHQ